MRKIIPWIPFFGGIYAQFNAVEFFKDLQIQFINFIYHLLIMALALLFFVK